MQFTLTQAAQLFGKNKSTVHRAMTSGRLSYRLSPNGVRLIDMAELIRVYDEPPSHATKDATAQPSTLVGDATAATELLEVMRAMLVEMQEMRRELIELREQQHLLPSPSPELQKGSSGSVTESAQENSGKAAESAAGSSDPHGLRATLGDIFRNA